MGDRLHSRDMDGMPEIVRPVPVAAVGSHALFKQRAKQQKALSKPKPPPPSEAEQLATNQERLRLHLAKQKVLQEQTRTLESAKKRQRLEEEEAAAKKAKLLQASAALAEYEVMQKQGDESTPPTLQRSSSSLGAGRSKQQSATAWVERLLMPSDFVERLWDGEHARREIRQKRLVSANPEDGVVVHVSNQLGDPEYRVSDPEYWRGYKPWLEPCGEGSSKKAYRITESAWGGESQASGHGAMEKTSMLLKGRFKYENLAVVVTRAERKLDNGKMQKGDSTLDVRLELCNTLRAAVAAIGPPVVMGRAAGIDGVFGYSRLVLVAPFCETLDEALQASDEAAAAELWTSTERLMLQIARGRLLLADFKPGNLLVRRVPNQPPLVWCSDFDDTLSTWDVDAPPLAIAAIHLSLLGLHLLAQRTARTSSKGGKSVSGVEAWIPLVASRVRAVQAALEPVTELTYHPMLQFAFPRAYLHSSESWVYRRSKHANLGEALEKVLTIVEGYFRKHKPYAEMHMSRRLFAHWGREDGMVGSMLAVVEECCSK